MKNLFLLLALMLPAVACGPRDGIRTVRIAEGQDADLGTIKEIEGPVTVRLLIRNDYPDTLRPVQLYTPCGCTQARFDQKPVAPGADEILEVTYNPAYRPGPMREEIQVRYTNSPVRVRTFSITGNVVGFNHPIEEDRPYAFGEGLYMSHKVLSYGSLRPGETGDFYFRHGNGNTSTTTSAPDNAPCDRFTRSPPSPPDSSSRPAVSTNVTGPSGSISIGRDTGSVVVPATSDTTATSCPASAFSSRLFPAFRLPASTIRTLPPLGAVAHPPSPAAITSATLRSPSFSFRPPILLPLPPPLQRFSLPLHLL